MRQRLFWRIKDLC